MARKITDKPNALPVSGTYPYGDIKDNSGSGDGVPVNRMVYADFHQFFARIADLAGIVLNSLPDNAVNGWQFVTALQTLIANAVASEASIRSSADTNLTNTKVAKSGDTMSGNLAMGGNKVTGLAAASSNGESVRYEELQSEISVRSSADTTLQNNITTEASTRSSADANILNQTTPFSARVIAFDRIQNQYEAQINTGAGGGTVLVQTIALSKHSIIEVEMISVHTAGSDPADSGSGQKKIVAYKITGGTTLNIIGTETTIHNASTTASAPVLSLGVSGLNFNISVSVGSGESYDVKIKTSITKIN